MGGLYLFNRDFISAIAELKKSVDLNPSFAPTHLWIGSAQLAMNQTEEAKASMDTALRLSPKDPMASMIFATRAFAHLLMDEYEEAEDWGRKSIGTPSAHQSAYSVHAAVLGFLDRKEEAHATMHAFHLAMPGTIIKRLSWALPYFANESLMAKFVEGLRRAGIAE